MFGSDKKTRFNGKIALQLRVDGDRFAMPVSIPDKLNGAVELLTHKCALTPPSELETKSPEEILANCGIVLNAKEIAMKIEHGENVVLMAIEEDRLRAMHKLFGEETIFTSPLLRRAQNASRHIIIYRNLSLTHISVFNGGELSYAEVFQTPTVTDSLYWLSRVYGALNFNSFSIYVTNGDRALHQLLRKHYKYVSQCE